ncbi:MAG TPA: hypothetical protein VJ398_06685 [Acidimicrobiia bacterium]|nr:hypothetical protein [Acidimicrobiia bacterium]
MVGGDETYNHLDLRKDLDGEELDSGSAAAVLLPLFREHGDDLVDLLDGIFALVIVDEEGETVAARDSIGIKPLYRAQHGDDLAYASELKALAERGWDSITAIPPGHLCNGGTARPFYRLPPPRCKQQA